MKEEKKADKREKSEKDSRPVDAYTGEVEPDAEDAYKVTELAPVDEGDREGEDFLLEEETAIDKVAADEDADAIVEKEEHFTEDEDIEEVFEDRQNLASGGRQELEEKLNEYNAQSPDLSADDIDAAWEDSIASGEESVGGSAPTPDQDRVDEIGEALGITYADDEPLGGEEKLRERDRSRLDLENEEQEETT